MSDQEWKDTALGHIRKLLDAAGEGLNSLFAYGQLLGAPDIYDEARAFLGRASSQVETSQQVEAGATLTVPLDADDDFAIPPGRNRREFRLVPIDEPDRDAVRSALERELIDAALDAHHWIGGPNQVRLQRATEALYRALADTQPSGRGK